VEGEAFCAMSSHSMRGRSKDGYRRINGRWEGRYRPQSRFELKPDKIISAAFKGFANGMFKYEFLGYY
jgi:hypothetical protein